MIKFFAIWYLIGAVLILLLDSYAKKNNNITLVELIECGGKKYLHMLCAVTIYPFYAVIVFIILFIEYVREHNTKKDN